MGRSDATSPLQTVDRALQILGLFSPVCPELAVAQVARALEVDRSIASRLLAALERRRFVVQDLETGRFRLGVRNLDLGALYLQSHRLVTAATPYLEQLGREQRDRSNTPTPTANLFILDSGQALRLGSYPARPLTRLRVPLHCTAAGKVLLASLWEPALQRVVDEQGLSARTSRTITDPAALRQCLHEVRHNGYATDVEENELGSYCFAAPIRDVAGSTVGAVSSSFPTVSRPDAEWTAQVVDTVCQIGRRISESLGSGPFRSIASEADGDRPAIQPGAAAALR